MSVLKLLFLPLFFFLLDLLLNLFFIWRVLFPELIGKLLEFRNNWIKHVRNILTFLSVHDKNNFLIHDYFFAKSIDKVRSGGVIAFITSSGTMDKKDDSIRRYIGARCDFLGAIRLPNNTFKGLWTQRHRWSLGYKNIYNHIK